MSSETMGPLEYAPQCTARTYRYLYEWPKKIQNEAAIGRPVPVMRHLSAYEAQALSIMVSAYKKWFGGRPW